jgi:hypothetical protein
MRGDYENTDNGYIWQCGGTLSDKTVSLYLFSLGTKRLRFWIRNLAQQLWQRRDNLLYFDRTIVDLLQVRITARRMSGCARRALSVSIRWFAALWRSNEMQWGQGLNLAAFGVDSKRLLAGTAIKDLYVSHDNG